MAIHWSSSLAFRCGTGSSSTHDAEAQSNPGGPSPRLARPRPRREAARPQRLYLEPDQVPSQDLSRQSWCAMHSPRFCTRIAICRCVDATDTRVASTSPSITGRPKPCRAPSTAHAAPSTGQHSTAPAVSGQLTALRLRDHGPKCPLPPAAVTRSDPPVDPDQIAQGPYPGHSRGQFSSAVDRQCPRVCESGVRRNQGLAVKSP